MQFATIFAEFICICMLPGLVPRLIEHAKEAKKHMKTITVKVWDQKGKKKFTRKFYLTVNKKLAPSIQEMFKEIYKSKERFPIHDIGCVANHHFLMQI